jgi:uncharacterized iron-regulated membrane protein
MTGSEPPVPAGARGADGRGPASGIPVALDGDTLDRIDRAWQQAEASTPDWSAVTLRVPARAGAPIAFTITDGASWNPLARSQLTLDAATLAVRQWQPYGAQSLGQRARGWVRFGHTGELGGTLGQIAAGIGCVGGVVLVCTGVSLAARRLLAWVARRRRATAPAAAIPASTTSAS